jgi:hypothetical protein
MKNRRIVALEQVPEDQRTQSWPSCFYCYSPRHNRTGKAVAAIEVEVEPPGENQFFGICGNHLEVSPLTGEWQMRKTL